LNEGFNILACDCADGGDFNTTLFESRFNLFKSLLGFGQIHLVKDDNLWLLTQFVVIQGQLRIDLVVIGQRIFIRAVQDMY
jgi:hypothetical protein